MKKFFLCLLLPLLLAVSCPSTPVSTQQGEKGVDLSYTPQTPDTENNYPLEPMSGKTECREQS